MDEFYSVSKELSTYSEQHTTEPTALLKKLERDTYLKQLNPRMVAGHLQGQLLRMLSLMIRPTRILEIGTFTGYSAICLAAGLPADGQLHTIEIEEELRTTAQSNFDQSPFKNQIQLHIGDAMKIIPTLNESFDLVFIDAKKQMYATYLELLIDKVKSGGFILTDNVLWNGKVLQQPMDKDARNLDLFNKKVHQDTRVENILLPIRDGILIMRKL